MTSYMEGLILNNFLFCNYDTYTTK